MSKNQFKIKENIKNMVKFDHHDFIEGNSRGRFHLILCRNLFIFFTPELQKEMFHKIHMSLKKDGILVLGTAETVRDRHLFHFLSSSDHIYRKIA